MLLFFFQAEDGIRDWSVTGVQTCALPIWPWPAPAAGEAVVKMRAAPINPADLNQIEGKYPVRAELPATPGFEGAGLVAEVGENVTNVAEIGRASCRERV